MRILQEHLGYARRRLQLEREGTRAWHEAEGAKSTEDHDDDVPAIMDPPERSHSGRAEDIEEAEFREYGNTSLLADPGSDYEDLADRLHDFEF